MLPQVALVPNLQPTCKYQIIALDPTVRVRGKEILTAVIEIPMKNSRPGPRGYRVQVVDYDASNQILYEPVPYSDAEKLKVPSRPEKDRAYGQKTHPLQRMLLKALS